MALDAVHDTGSFAGVSFAELKEAAIAQAQTALDEWLRHAGAPRETLMHVGTGPRVETLLEMARDVGADLIVLGAADLPDSPARAGAFASAILRTAPTKVLLVRPEHALPFLRVVACIDFSDSSEEVVSQAVRVATQDGSEVHFLHVFQSPWQRWLHRSPLASALPGVVEKLSGGLHTRLADFVKVPDKVSAQLRVREAESHGAGIIEHAREIEADLVILGRRAQRDPQFAFHGSTVEELLRALPCSVLAVKPPMATWGDVGPH
jgi:nucleotide-binding universal stress UspA family protein